MTAPDPAEALAEVLAEHEGCYRTDRRGDFVAWSCGIETAHRRPPLGHVATAVLAAIVSGQVPGVGRVETVKAEALREAADRWTQSAWSDVMPPKPTPPAVPVIAYANRVGDWLRQQADSLAAPVPRQVDPEEVTRWRRRALFAEEAIRRAMRLYHAAIRDGLTLQPTAVRDALAPQTIEASGVVAADPVRTRGEETDRG